jgi:hypothetical protein
MAQWLEAKLDMGLAQQKGMVLVQPWELMLGMRLGREMVEWLVQRLVEKLVTGLENEKELP